MVTLRKAVVVAIGVSALTFGGAVTANAAPGDDGSCPLAVSLLCHFLPGTSDLDHDVDLTKDSTTLNGDTIPQMPAGTADTENGPPISPCVGGCT